MNNKGWDIVGILGGSMRAQTRSLMGPSMGPGEERETPPLPSETPPDERVLGIAPPWSSSRGSTSSVQQLPRRRSLARQWEDDGLGGRAYGPP
jgi:hypothetical protein